MIKKYINKIVNEKLDNIIAHFGLILKEVQDIKKELKRIQDKG